MIDIFRIRQYFTAALGVGEFAAGMRHDAEFLSAVRKALVPLPTDEPTLLERHPFSRRRSPKTYPIEGSFGVVASGGSGALASLVGVWRALEDWKVTPEVVTVCSGSALFGFPLAAGIRSDAVADFSLSLQPKDYIDINWRDTRRLLFELGRGFAGVLKGDRLEETYRDLVGDMTLAELPIPCYAPLWNIEENRVGYIGPETHPHLSVARAIRASIALPLFLDPIPMDGGYWCDGGIVDIFPAEPLLTRTRAVDRVLAINAFYPPDFLGEDARGWRQQRGSIFRVASQVRTAQQIELARLQLRRLRAVCDVTLLSPVPYSVVQGAGFYKQFLDHSQWADFMRAGRQEANSTLARWSGHSLDGEPDMTAHTPRARSAKKRAPGGGTTPRRRTTR